MSIVVLFATMERRNYLIIASSKGRRLFSKSFKLGSVRNFDSGHETPGGSLRRLASGEPQARRADPCFELCTISYHRLVSGQGYSHRTSNRFPASRSVATCRPTVTIMTSLRPMRPSDLLHMNLTTLDPLTENYNIDYYMHYLNKWPTLCTIAEDHEGNIIGYSMASTRRLLLRCSFFSREPCTDRSRSVGQSRRRSRLVVLQRTLSSMAWACHSAHCRPAVETLRSGAKLDQSAGARL